MQLRRLAGVAAGLTFLATFGVACSDSVPTAEEGACIEELSLIGDISELPTVDCDEDHAGQVVGLFDHEGGDDFPGDDEIEEEAEERCQELFEDFVGAPVEETSLSFGAINPTEDTWEQADDRETICVATTRDGSDLDQSVEDAADDFEGDGAVPFDETEDEIGDSGEDTSLEDFADDVEACEDGDMAVCDQLFLETPAGSEAETVGATCGGRSDTEIPTQCETEFG